ncbi:PilZ domain-containing protein [Pseudoalteromonas fenneropenaei]|uniref:Cyclic diguanosine monophosphate-binding protein n=1 Tax=Pseudoalteromonas fenneropenaei TaxID=1737459 RepID=A0ABV7CH83_9GAMM
MEDRRRFTRVLFSSRAKLMTAGGDYNCELLDLSLNGALVSLPLGFIAMKDEPASLRFALPESDVVIHMQVEIRHIENAHLGLHCTQIDLESVTHLKRLIELNLGSDLILYRELEQLAIHH